MAKQLQSIKATEAVKKTDHFPPDFWLKTVRDKLNPTW